MAHFYLDKLWRIESYVVMHERSVHPGERVVVLIALLLSDFNIDRTVVSLVYLYINTMADWQIM